MRSPRRFGFPRQGFTGPCALRLADGSSPQRPRSRQDFVKAVRAVVGDRPGLSVEEKTYSVAVHYRGAPHERPRIEAALRDLLREEPDDVVLAAGRKVIEVAPRLASKGGALLAFMNEPPFAGRRPIMIGDDAPDESAMAVYGGVILAASQIFFDERLPKTGDRALFDLLEPLGVTAISVALTRDAGIWEYRGRQRVHTYSAAMCWVACDRLGRIAERLGLSDRTEQWRKSAAGLRETILERAWNAQSGRYCGSLDGDDVDESVLLLHELGIVSPADPKFVASVEAIGRRLGRDSLLLRYDAPDDFGAPTVAFVVCTFWYVVALAAIGRADEARAMFEKLLARRNPLGLLSEDIDPASGELWGNFPQTYSMVGIIITAMRLSTGWERAR